MPHFPPPRRSRSGSHRAVPPSLRPSPFGRVGVKDEEISQAAPSSPAPAASPPPAAPPAAPIAQQPPSPAPSPSPVAAPSSPPAAAPTPPAPNQAAPTPAPAQQTQQPAQPAQPRITAPWVPRWNSEPTLSPNIQDFDDVHGEVTSWLLDNQQPLSQLLQNSENDSNRFAQRVATLFGNNLIQQGMHIDNVRHIQDAIFDLSLTEAEYLKEEEKQRTATPTTQEGWSEELFGQPLRGGELLHRATPLLGVAALPGAQVVLRHVDKFGLNFSIKHPDLVSADRKLYVSRATGRKIIYNEILRSRYPGQGLGSRLLAAQVEQARQHGFIIQTLGLDYVNGAGEHSMQGASFWPRVGYNAPLRDISGTKLYDKIREHYPEAQTLQDLMYSPGGTEAWKQWVAEELDGVGDKIGVDLIFDPNDEKAVALLTNYNLRKQQKLASQGKSFQVKEADLAAHYEDPGASPEDDDLLVQAAQQAQQQFGAFGSKSFRPTEYTPALYRSYDTASLPRGELDNEELHNSNSHGNLFGTAQVTSHKKPPQESLESYDFDSPEHRVKELETPHKFSSTQFDLDQAGYPRSQGSPVAKLKEIQDSIQDSDLAEDGKEDNFHVTVLYGLHGDNPKEVEHVLRHWLMDREHTSLQAQLGEVSLFPANEQNSQRGGAYYDVVKVDVDSDDLHSLHNFLAQHLQHTDTHPEYHPHVTLAYVKPGLGWLYVGEDLNGHIIHLNKFVFSDKHGQKTIIDLSKLKTCPQCGHKIKALDNEPGWRCSQPPCEWSLFAAGDTDMDKEAHPQPPISNQEPWERAHRDRKEEEVQPYTNVKGIGGLGLGNGFTFYRQAFDRWRTKPNVLGERRLILAYRRHKPADELAMQNDEEFRMKKESTQPTQSEQKRPKNTCPDGSKRPPGTGSCQGREGGWDGRGDNEQSLTPEENWYPGDMPAGVPPKEKAFRCPDGSPRPHSQATCAGREGWVPWTEEERLQNTLSEPPKGPRAEHENIHAKYPNTPRVTPSPFGRKSLDKKSAPQRAVAADLVTLPKDIEGTNCKNCQFLAKDQKDYCQHPDLMLHLWDGAERMTCSLWDAEGVKHPDAKQRKKSLPVLDANELARAQKADLITLPKDVENTSCCNCEYQQDKYCHNPKVDQPVTPHNCCNYWDADGVKRAWEQQGNKAFDRPLHMPPRYRLHPEQDTYRSIEGTDLYSRQDFGKGLRYQTKDEETETETPPEPKSAPSQPSNTATPIEQGQAPSVGTQVTAAQQPAAKPMTIAEFRQRHREQRPTQPAAQPSPNTPVEKPPLVEPQWTPKVNQFIKEIVEISDPFKKRVGNFAEEASDLEKWLAQEPVAQEWIENNFQPYQGEQDRDSVFAYDQQFKTLTTDLEAVRTASENNRYVLEHLQQAQGHKQLHHLALRLQPRIHSSQPPIWDENVLADKNLREIPLPPQPKNQLLRQPQPGDPWYLRDEQGRILIIARIKEVSDNADTWGIVLDLGARRNEHTPEEIEAYKNGYESLFASRYPEGSSQKWFNQIGVLDRHENRLFGASAWGIEPDPGERVEHFANPYTGSYSILTDTRSALTDTILALSITGHFLLRATDTLDTILEDSNGDPGSIPVNVVSATLDKLIAWEWNDVLEKDPAAGQYVLDNVAQDTINAYLPIGEWSSDSLKALIREGLPGAEAMQAALPKIEKIEGIVKRALRKIDFSDAPEDMIRLAQVALTKPKDLGREVLQSLKGKLVDDGYDYFNPIPWFQKKGALPKRIPRADYIQLSKPLLFHAALAMAKQMRGQKALSWLGSGGDLVAPPAWGGPKDEEKLHKAFSSLQQVKALPPLSHGHQPTLAVDLDGTLADTPPHAGAMDLDLVHPRPGAIEAMEHFHKLGWRIIIWTCRDDIKGIEGWLKQHNIPWDFINENPDQPTDSPKIIADYYLDDRSIRPDNWQQAQAEIEQAAEARQPVGADANYETLKKLGEESLPLLAKLMATLGYPTLQLDRIAPNELEGRLQQPGPLVLLAPLKAQQRAEQKVESDYGGDWTRLLDMVRAAVAVDTFDELKAAMAKLEESASLARKPKNRFKKPLANGYRDYLINYKLPNGFICEVQFHLKPILAAREKEKLAYDIVRAIRAALQEEGRSSMTSGEVAAMQRARATSQRLFEEAWQHALQQQPDKKEKKKKMLTAPRVKASPFGRVFGKAGYTGIFRDRLGRRTCYAAGHKVPCNPHGNNATDDSNKPSPRPPELDQPIGPPTGAAGGKPKQPTLEGAGGPGVPNYYGMIFNQEGQLLIQPGNDPLGGFIWAVPSPANERPIAGLLQEVQQATDAVPRQIGEIGEPDQRNGYYLLKVEDAGDQSQQWSSPKEVEEQLQQLQDPAWQKRGLDVLHAAVQQWQQSQRRRKSLIAPSPFGKKAQPTFTGPIKDSRGRRMCFRDGKHAPCEQFGGKGEGWQQQRATEDLYDAARRLVSKSKTGDANGQNELLSMLAATPPEELASLKRDHNLHAAPASKEELRKQIIDKLSKLGYEVEEGQTQGANPLG